MPRHFRLALSLLAGLTACYFEFDCTSQVSLIGLIVCLILWWKFRPSGPVYFHPVLAQCRNLFLIIALAYIVGAGFLPPPLHTLFTYTLDALFLLLILTYAYADYRDE